MEHSFVYTYTCTTKLHKAHHDHVFSKQYMHMFSAQSEDLLLKIEMEYDYQFYVTACTARRIVPNNFKSTIFQTAVLRSFTEYFFPPHSPKQTTNSPKNQRRDFNDAGNSLYH